MCSGPWTVVSAGQRRVVFAVGAWLAEAAGLQRATATDRRSVPPRCQPDADPGDLRRGAVPAADRRRGAGAFGVLAYSVCAVGGAVDCASAMEPVRRAVRLAAVDCVHQHPYRRAGTAGAQ